jgi:DNA-directed RNA polymerase subunit F
MQISEATKTTTLKLDPKPDPTEKSRGDAEILGDADKDEREDAETIVLRNRQVVNFYKTHPHINPELANLMLIDFMEKIHDKEAIQSKVNTQLVTEIQELQHLISNKMREFHKETTETTRLLVESTSMKQSENLMQKLEKTTQIFAGSIADILPNQSQDITRTLLDQFNVLRENLLNKTDQGGDAKDAIQAFEHKFTAWQHQSYATLQTQIHNLGTQITQRQSDQDRTMAELSEFLARYKSNSSFKGQYSENRLETILHQTFKDADIVNSSGQRASGDFILKRSGNGTGNGSGDILVENKDYKTNVCIEEVAKFIRDVGEQKCHGILMSQHSGIYGKPDFFVEIHDSRFVLVYLHDTDYSADKIKTAVAIIDHLSPKLAQINAGNPGGITVGKETMDYINSQYHSFLTHKENLTTSLREFVKKHQSMIEELKLPTLEGILREHYASVQNQSWKCEVCGECFAKKQGLASHRKAHKV